MSDQSNIKKSFRREAEGTARDERNIQGGIDSIDKRRPPALQQRYAEVMDDRSSSAAEETVFFPRLQGG
jgi:hypothetical protein